MKWLSLAAWVVFVSWMTFVVHELAHALSGKLLGYDMFVRANSAFLVSGDYRSAFDEHFIDLAGPVITILQGVLGLWLATAYRWRWAAPVALSALLMRVLAAVASLNNPNDEARVATDWGIGYWTLHAVVVGILLVLTVLTFRALKVKWGEGLFAGVLIVVSFVAVIVAEPSLPTFRI